LQKKLNIRISRYYSRPNDTIKFRSSPQSIKNQHFRRKKDSDETCCSFTRCRWQKVLLIRFNKRLNNHRKFSLGSSCQNSNFIGSSRDDFLRFSIWQR